MQKNLQTFLEAGIAIGRALHGMIDASDCGPTRAAANFDHDTEGGPLFFCANATSPSTTAQPR
jgi:hypothetical protein